MIRCLRYIFFVIGCSVACGAGYAADIASFIVTVKPDTFAVGEAVDIEIRAVDAKGEVVTDYEKDVFFQIKESNSLKQKDFTLPSDSYYQFVPKDQGIKTFSKGLIVKKPGTYTFVAERLDKSVSGEATITVTDPNAAGVTTSVDVVITSPTSNTVLDRQSVDVIGVAADAPNTPIFVDVNGSMVNTEKTTDGKGKFAITVADLVEGNNVITVQLQDVDGNIMGASDPFSVSVQLDNTPLFSGFVRNPDTNLEINEEASVVVQVAERVTSVSLVVDDNSYPLDRIDATSFNGSLKFQDAGTYALSLKMYVEGEMTEQDVDDVIVNPAPEPTPVPETTTVEKGSYGIGLIRYVADPLTPGKVMVDWEVEGDQSSHYTVFYGTSEETLDNAITVSSTGATLSTLSLDEVNYVQVWPSTEDGTTQGEPSDPLMISFLGSAPSCVIKGITLRSEKRGSDYYLVWDAVEGADTYSIYRSTTATTSLTDMSVISTVKGTSYQYPFDPKADHEQYAYYAVQANCADNTTAQVGDIEKVQVGPVSSALMVLLLVIGVYFLYRVNVYQE